MAWFGGGAKTNIESTDDCFTCDNKRDCSFLSVLEDRPIRRQEPILGCTDRSIRICKVCGAEYD